MKTALYFFRDAALVTIGAFCWLVIWTLVFFGIAWLVVKL